MNILHIIAQKPDSTGSGVYLAQTVKGFDALGCHQAVIAGIGPEDAPAFPADVLFRPVRFESPELPFPVVGMSDVMPYRATQYRDLTPEMVECFERAFTEALDDVLARFAPDLVICHHLYLLTALVAHRRLPCKVVGLSHSTDLRQMDKTDLERAYIRAGVGMLDEIWSLNTAQAAEIGRVYNVRAERIRIVGVGYDDTVFHPADAAQVESEDGCSAQPAGKPVAGSGESRRLELAYAGKIWQKKGIGSLLAALDQLPYPPDKLRLRLAGGYSDRAGYEALVARAQACAYEVDFLGKLAPADLARLYRACDTFVLPSFFEGMPLVVIEALACGCKVVVTDLPGIREWLDAQLPSAPITFVEPPRMHDTDEPDLADLPRFEHDLARSLQQSLEAPRACCDTTHLSWANLCRRLVGLAPSPML